MSALIRVASPLVCPEHRMGDDPPLVSMSTSDSTTPVVILTDDTCAR